ncbi:hypothetical protein ACFX10_034506 [Malus domestica]
MGKLGWPRSLRFGFDHVEVVFCTCSVVVEAGIGDTFGRRCACSSAHLIAFFQISRLLGIWVSTTMQVSHQSLDYYENDAKHTGVLDEPKMKQSKCRRRD